MYALLVTDIMCFLPALNVLEWYNKTSATS